MRGPGFYNPLEAVLSSILPARAFALASLCALGALRRIVGGETITAPGGAGTLS